MQSAPPEIPGTDAAGTGLPRNRLRSPHAGTKQDRIEQQPGGSVEVAAESRVTGKEDDLSAASTFHGRVRGVRPSLPGLGPHQTRKTQLSSLTSRAGTPTGKLAMKALDPSMSTDSLSSRPKVSQCSGIQRGSHEDAVRAKEPLPGVVPFQFLDVAGLAGRLRRRARAEPA